MLLLFDNCSSTEPNMLKKLEDDGEEKKKSEKKKKIKHQDGKDTNQEEEMLRLYAGEYSVSNIKSNFSTSCLYNWNKKRSLKEEEEEEEERDEIEEWMIEKLHENSSKEQTDQTEEEEEEEESESNSHNLVGESYFPIEFHHMKDEKDIIENCPFFNFVPKSKNRSAKKEEDSIQNTKPKSQNGNLAEISRVFLSLKNPKRSKFFVL